MASDDRCLRCDVRVGSPLCAVCAPAGPLQWHAGRPGTWLPTACVAAALVTVLALAASGGLLALASSLAASPGFSLPSLDWLRLGAQGWWIALGAPTSLSVDATTSVDGAMVPVGTFVGQVRLASLLGLAPAGLALIAGGALLAARVGAAAEIEHLVAGALLGLPAALASGAAAWLLPFAAHDLRVGDARLTVSLMVSPLHAAAVALLWGLLAGALGAAARYAWRTRGLAGRWDGLARGAWAPLAGGVSALCLTAVLATVCGAAQWTTLTGDAVKTTLNINSEVSSLKTLATEAMLGAQIAVAACPLSLDSGAPIEGRVTVGVPPEQAEDFADLPTDTQTRVQLTTGLTASDPVGAVASTLPVTAWAWLLIGVMGGGIAGAISGSLSPARSAWRRALGAALVHAVGVLALAAWMGVWATGHLLFAGATPPGLDLWAAWQASLPAAFGGSLLLALPGALAAAHVRSRGRN